MRQYAILIPDWLLIWLTIGAAISLALRFRRVAIAFIIPPIVVWIIKPVIDVILSDKGLLLNMFADFVFILLITQAYISLIFGKDVASNAIGHIIGEMATSTAAKTYLLAGFITNRLYAGMAKLPISIYQIPNVKFILKGDKMKKTVQSVHQFIKNEKGGISNIFVNYRNIKVILGVIIVVITGTDASTKVDSACGSKNSVIIASTEYIKEGSTLQDVRTLIVNDLFKRAVSQVTGVLVSTKSKSSTKTALNGIKFNMERQEFSQSYGFVDTWRVLEEKINHDVDNPSLTMRLEITVCERSTLNNNIYIYISEFEKDSKIENISVRDILMERISRNFDGDFILVDENDFYEIKVSGKLGEFQLNTNDLSDEREILKNLSGGEIISGLPSSVQEVVGKVTAIIEYVYLNKKFHLNKSIRGNLLDEDDFPIVAQKLAKKISEQVSLDIVETLGRVRDSARLNR